MDQWFNSSGYPLSNEVWLSDHHQAKVAERVAFVSNLDLSCKKIVDLGCGPGLWLDIFDKFAPDNCEFVGIDSDQQLLDSAVQKSKHWNRSTKFVRADLNHELSSVPDDADYYLAFNFLPFLDNPTVLLHSLTKQSTGGSLLIRQYDGQNMRFGPMPAELRQALDSSVFSAVHGSEQIEHYPIDKLLSTIIPIDCYKKVNFELYERFGKDGDERFLRYFHNSVAWLKLYCNDAISDQLTGLVANFEAADYDRLYFSELDLVCLLSWS